MNKIIFLLILLFINPLNAKYFSVEVKRTSPSPALSNILQEVNQSPPPASFSLVAFNTVQPTAVRYLIDERASGNLKNIMDTHPLWSMSRLQQMLLVTYPDSIDSQSIKDSLDNDADVKSYHEILASDYIQLSAFHPQNRYPRIPFKAQGKGKTKPQGYKAVTATIQAAWELSEGMGYIGAIDTGIEINHPDLRAFDENGNYVGGNLLDGYYHVDTAETNYDTSGNVTAIDLNIDEAQPIPETTANTNCDANDGLDDGWIESSFIGHGSHVAGILVAKDNDLGNNNTVSGICKNCGLSMMKFNSVKFGTCEVAPNNPNVFYHSIKSSATSEVNAFNAILGVGANVLNLSGGAPFYIPSVCYNFDNSNLCYPIYELDKREVVFVAAAGNNLQRFLNFPANETSVIAVGGLNDNQENEYRFWNTSYTGSGGNQFGYGDTNNCPTNHPDTFLNQEPSFRGCGSNFSFYDNQGNVYLDHSTDVVAQAQNVFSTFYNGKNHLYLTKDSCTDKYDDTPNDGYGLCTGTSMSTPQVAAIYQLMRSASPLLPNGTRDPDNLIGLRNIMNATADQIAGYPQFEAHFGFGQPNGQTCFGSYFGQIRWCANENTTNTDV